MPSRKEWVLQNMKHLISLTDLKMCQTFSQLCGTLLLQDVTKSLPFLQTMKQKKHNFMRYTWNDTKGFSKDFSSRVFGFYPNKYTVADQENLKLEN